MIHTSKIFWRVCGLLFALTGGARAQTGGDSSLPYESRHLISNLRGGREIVVGYVSGSGSIAGNPSLWKSSTQFVFRRRGGRIWCLIFFELPKQKSSRVAVTRLSANDVRRLDNLFAFYRSPFRAPFDLSGVKGQFAAVEEGQPSEWIILGSNFSTETYRYQYLSQGAWLQKNVLPLPLLATQALQSGLDTSDMPAR